MAKAKTAKANPRNKKLYDDGMKVRKAVLGSAYVDNSMASADDFMMSFQDVTTEYCWGYVWTRPGLTKKTRSSRERVVDEAPLLAPADAAAGAETDLTLHEPRRRARVHAVAIWRMRRRVRTPKNTNPTTAAITRIAIISTMSATTTAKITRPAATSAAGVPRTA